MLFAMATMWYVLSVTHSPVATATIPLISMVAFAVLGTPAATLVDRLSKKGILVATDLFRCLIIAGAWLALETNHLRIIDIYIAILCLSVSGFMFNPAQQSALPHIVRDPNKHLTLANALLAATSQMVSLFGYAVGGIIVSLIHVNSAILLDAVSFLISGLSFLPIPIRVPRAVPKKGVRGFVYDSFEGIRFIWSKQLLRIFIGFFFVINLIAAPMAIFTIVYTKDILHANINVYGYLEASSAIGGILGSLFSGKFSRRLLLWQWLFLSLLVAGTGILLMPLFPHVWFAMFLLSVISAVLVLLNIPLITSVQLLVPDELRGRVMNSFSLFVSGLSGPLGILAGGWFMGTFSPKAVFVTIGVILIAAGLISLGIRPLRTRSELDLGFEKS